MVYNGGRVESWNPYKYLFCNISVIFVISYRVWVSHSRVSNCKLQFFYLWSQVSTWGCKWGFSSQGNVILFWVLRAHLSLEGVVQRTGISLTKLIDSHKSWLVILRIGYLVLLRVFRWAHKASRVSLLPGRRCRSGLLSVPCMMPLNENTT